MFKKIKAILHTFYVYPLFTIIASLIMVFLLYAVYLIPTDKIRDNIKNSDQLPIPLTQPIHNSNLSGTQIDTATDARMINMAIMPLYENTFQDALLNPRIHYYSNRPEYSLFYALNDRQLNTKKIRTYPITLSDSEKGSDISKENIRIDLYPRYWHCWLIFLKPLLLVFDVKQIKIINLLLQLSLLIIILQLMYKRLGLKYDLALITALCFLNPLTTWQCLVYAIDVNIMLLAILWILLNKNPNDKYIFFIIGTIIIFNFPCFPLLTLAIPLIIHICLYNRSFTENIKNILQNSLLWTFGYASMMLVKWVLASIFTPYNIITHACQNVLHRIRSNFENGNYLGEITYSDTLLNNINEFKYMSSLYYLAFFIITLFIIYLIKPYKFQYDKKALIILGIGLMPFIWYFILMQHAYVHFTFTHKTLVVTIYAILTAITCCLQNSRHKKN